MIASIYIKLTGLFTGLKLQGSETFINENLALNEEWAAMEGDHDHRKVRVVDGKVVPREVPEGHQWHAATGKFVPNVLFAQAEADRQARFRIAQLENRAARAHRELVRDPNDQQARKRILEIDDQIAELRKDLKDPVVK